MKLHTEKEFLFYNQQEAFRLRQLFMKDRGLFDEVADYLPFTLHINSRKNLNTIFTNKAVIDSSGYEGEQIIQHGFSYVRKISDPEMLERALSKIQLFDLNNDPLSSCSVMQHLKFDGKMRFFYINKLFLDEEHYLNIGFRMDKLGKPGILIQNILSDVIGDMNGYQKFQTLTKQEKQILMMLGKGYSNERISEQLFISQHTVKTHRKKIYAKLEAKSIADLIRYAQAFELI